VIEKTEMAISIKNLSKIYKLYDKNIDRLKESIHPLGKTYHRDFYALNNVSFEVKKGEVLGIIGKNGSGKSTLLSIISGILAPSSGQVKTRGRISALLGLEVGFNPELNGIENIYFNGSIQGYSKEEMEEKLDDILSFADIGDFIYQPIKIYSSGMKARLSFALAININPEILIVDEVLAVGDAFFQRKCYTKMQSFMNEGKTILFVTHAVNIVNEFCNRAVLMDRGELILEGPSKYVTMYYQKLLFSQIKNVSKVRNEIIKLNQDEEKKKKFNSDLEKKGNKTIDHAETHNHKKNDKPKQVAFYIPDFKPRTSVFTKNYNIDLYDFHIKTLDGKKVNVLVSDEKYFISYKVKFNVAAENVKFGMGISTEKGFFMGGKLEKYDVTEKINKGDEFLVEWHFKCNLVEGNYFFGTGIRSLVDDEEIVLSRINDAVVFKVQKNHEADYSGKVNFNQYLKIIPLNKKI